MHSATALALALALVVLPAPAGAKKRTPCGDTSWVIADPPIVPGDATLAHNGIVLRDGKLALGGVCAPVKAKRKASKKGTRLGARWKSCTGVSGPVKLKATTDATCQTLTGTVTAKKASLNVSLAATAVPSGDVIGQVRVVRAVAVPVEVRSEAIAQASTIASMGKTVAPDGSSIANPPTGAAGWRVRLGDETTHTDSNGVFRFHLDPAPATELELFHPAEADPVIVFFALPHLAPAAGSPTPVDVEVTTQGPCGMDEAPADEPAYCAALPDVTPAAVGTRHASHHAHHHADAADGDGAVAAPITFTFKTGTLGSYPSYSGTSCADQDGGFGFSGETTFGALTNYLFSTCDTQVVFGCCDNELGSIKVSIKSALGKITGFKPTACDKNHKGRLCQDVLQGDVGVQVPAGSASGHPQIQSIFGFPAAVGQTVTPGQVVPVTVHHNGCYGSTDVEKTLDELGGVLSGVTAGKIDHFTLTGTKFTFTPDVAITYTAGQCPAGKATASDSYDFTTDGYTATVTFTMTCATAVTTTTTVTTGQTTTTIAGRAVQLLYPAGSNQAGTSVCLSRITGGCVAQAHLPFCSYVHLHGGNEFGIGIDGNGPYQDPEFTQSEPCGFGAVTTVPGCGPDAVPPC